MPTPTAAKRSLSTMQASRWRRESVVDYMDHLALATVTRPDSGRAVAHCAWHVLTLGVPTPPVHAPPGSGAEKLPANSTMNCWRRASAVLSKKSRLPAVATIGGVSPSFTFSLGGQLLR